MPYDVTFESLPAGYVVTSARTGEKFALQLTGFVSSEDGDELITKLEGLPQQILSMLPLPPPLLPSTVHTLLAVIRKDKTATVYLNEVRIVGHICIKDSCQKGELITTDRVLDMGPLEFAGVDIPRDAGVVYVFSVGWRKGFFYDLSPLHGVEGKPRPYDLAEVIGSFYAYLTFQERFKIDDVTWQTFFTQKWFPFVYLDNKLLREMISHASEGWQVDDLLPKISANVERLLRSHPLTEAKDPVFSDHSEILKTSVERYLAGDYISCASILYPRIEGLLRSFLRTCELSSKPTPKMLSKVAVEHHDTARIAGSLLLPAKFNEYLDTVYFAQFTSGSAPDVARHSVAHGEARTDAFSLKATTIAFLIVYQLSLFFSDGQKNELSGQSVSERKNDLSPKNSKKHKERPMARKFSDNPTRPFRALQIWQILIAAANNRQLLTYILLAKRLGYKSGHTLSQMLAHIMHYCQQNELPPLTILVVNQDTGVPGVGLTGADFAADRESVFRFDWCSIIPPTPEELEKAYQEGHH